MGFGDELKSGGLAESGFRQIELDKGADRSSNGDDGNEGRDDQDAPQPAGMLLSLLARFLFGGSEGLGGLSSFLGMA